MRLGNTAIRLSLLASVLLVGACTIDGVAESERKTENRMDKAEVLNEAAKEPAPADNFESVVVKDSRYVGSAAVRSRNGKPLPERFQGTSGFVLRAGKPLTISEVAEKVTELTDIPVEINLGAPVGSSGGGSDSESGSPSRPAGVSAQTAALGQDLGRVQPNYTGSLSGFLDNVTSNLGISWSYRDGTIYITKFVTRTFQLESFPGTTNVEATLGGSGSSSGGGDSGDATGLASANYTTEYSSEDLQFTKGLRESIRAIIGKEGRVRIDQATSAVTVVARPSVMGQVKSFIENYNRERSRTVAMNVKVLSVQMENRDAYGFDLQNALMDFGDGDITISGSGSLGQAAIGSASWSIVSGGLISQASGMVDALSTQGDVSVIKSTTRTTTNNVPAPIKATKQQSYVKQVSTTTTGETTQQEIETGTLRTGFDMNLIPQIGSDGMVRLKMFLTMSNLLNIEETSTDQATIQLPSTQSRSFTQQVEVPSGSTLVVSGFKRQRAEANLEGTGSERFPLLGGRQDGEQLREVVVIAVTPTVVDPKPPRHRAAN